MVGKKRDSHYATGLTLSVYLGKWNGKQVEGFGRPASGDRSKGRERKRQEAVKATFYEGTEHMRCSDIDDEFVRTLRSSEYCLNMSKHILPGPV